MLFCYRFLRLFFNVVWLEDCQEKSIMGKRLIWDFGFKVRFCFRLTCIPNSAFFTGRGYIFVYSVIPLHQLGETEIFQVAVPLRCIDWNKRNEPFHLFAALRALGKLVTMNGLLYFKVFPLFAAFSSMFVFIYRHFSSPALPAVVWFVTTTSNLK